MSGFFVALLYSFTCVKQKCIKMPKYVQGKVNEMKQNGKKYDKMIFFSKSLLTIWQRHDIITMLWIWVVGLSATPKEGK